MNTLHPIAVHLPIGLLVGNAVLTALYLWRGDRSKELAAYHCLWLGIVLLLPALATGTYAAVSQLVLTDSPRNDALGWINAHALAGILALAVYWQAWQVRRRNAGVLDAAKPRRAYLCWLAGGFALLALSGWLGGHMVYELGVGVK
ncbi:MAG: DUF2231 domain-containing protein [Roseiflexaceae bacterium]|nr:DUF2231 domain-containing protein [Roseiflexaceae bacterium]